MFTAHIYAGLGHWAQSHKTYDLLVLQVFLLACVCSGEHLDIKHTKKLYFNLWILVVFFSLNNFGINH